MRSLKIAIATATVALMLPAGSAIGATSTSDVTGTAISELTLGVATPSAMDLAHTAAAQTSSVVTVTSTDASWTLTIHDDNADGNGTAGHMDKHATACAGAFADDTLTNALEWNVASGSYSDLSGTPATVKTGSLIEAPVVGFRQALDPADAVATGDCYKLAVTYTVTAN